jgi:hypothetical protein
LWTDEPYIEPFFHGYFSVTDNTGNAADFKAKTFYRYVDEQYEPATLSNFYLWSWWIGV